MGASSRQHSRLLSGVLSACFIGMTATVAWYCFRQRAAVEAAAGHELAAVARVEATQIANCRRERIADGRLLRSLPAADHVRRLIEATAADDARRVTDILAATRQEYAYAAATMVDCDGAVLLRSSNDPEPRLQREQLAQLCRQARDAKDVTLSDISPNNRAGIRLMPMTAPIGQGAFVLEIEPTLFPYPFLSAWPGASKTGEGVLCRLEGEDLVFLRELRQWRGDVQLTRRSLKGFAIPTAEELRDGVLVRRTDYRGMPVLAHARSVPDSPWILVAKVDAAEVDAPLTRLAQEAWVIFVLIALATAAGVGWIWKSQQLRARHESEERFRAIADDTPAKLWMASTDGSEFFVNHGLSDRIGGLAARYGVMVAIGLDEKDGERLYDAATLVDRMGKLLWRRRKLEVLAELMDPPYAVGRVEDIGVVATELGRIGMLNCADTFIDAYAEKIREQRPDLVVVPYGWAAEKGAWPEHTKSLEDLVKRRAAQWQCPVVGTDLVGAMTSGPWAGRTFGGASVVADGSGTVIARLRDRDVEVRVVDVPLV